VSADIDAPDQIAWGLTFRQLAILACTAAILWVGYSRFPRLLPPLGWVGVAILTAGVAVVVALGKRDGLPLDTWVRHGLALHTTPRLLAPGNPAPVRELLNTPTRPLVPAPLRAEVTRIGVDGTLTVDGTTRSVIACGTTSVLLRTPTEQAGLLDGFARWLNALTSPAQIQVNAVRHDLTVHANKIFNDAPRLPHPALRTAAADHAQFLIDLDTAREPLRRQVLVVTTGALTTESVRALSGVGITAVGLDGEAVTAALATAMNPYHPPVPGPRAVPGTPITGRTR